MLKVIKICSRLVFFIGFFCFSQNTTEENNFLKKASYSELYNLIEKNYKDTILCLKYSNYYFLKAKKEDNKEQLVHSMTLKANYTKEENSKIRLLDSVINISKNLDLFDFPMLAITTKGGLFLEKGELDKALRQYMLSYNYSEKKNNEYYKYVNKHNIARVKGEVGEDNNALRLFKECLEYDRKIGEKSSFPYLLNLLSVAEYSIKTNQLDSATVYIGEGLLKTKGVFESLRARYLLQDGILSIRQKDYAKAESQINKSLMGFNPVLEGDHINNILCYNYLGEIYKQKKDSKKSMHYFFLMDSLSIRKNYFSKELKSGYYNWLELARSEESDEYLINVINNFLLYDNKLTTHGKQVSETITSEFEIPNLIRERDALKKSFFQKKTLWLYYKIGLLFIISLLSLYSFFQFRKKRRFKLLLENLKEKQIINEVDKNGSHKSNQNEIDIDKEIYISIVKKLDKFESEKGFLNPKISSYSLAKQIETNQHYLSKTINFEKKCSFSNYIKNLRVDYAINWINENQGLAKKYTIDAISKEFGFNNPETFSLAFKKKTGFKPSFFIKELTRKV